MKKNKGFTLIELLVVIAIIGILSSVVLASLNTARAKGADAAVKANLAGAKAEAAMFYDAGLTYTGVCAATGANTIGDNVLAAWQANSGTTATFTADNATVPSATVPACHDDATGWAAQVPLKSGVSFCVDSTGKSIETSTFLAANAVVCL
ncbi:MAG: type II secretion system protein [Candidatus Paceibacterota bacterium]